MGRRTSARARVPVLLAACVAGCAGVPAGGALQAIEIELVGVPGAAPPGPATCVLGNGDAEWTLSAPGRTTVTTGAGPLRVTCRAVDGDARGEAVAQAQVRGGHGERALVGTGVGVLAGAAVGALDYQSDRNSMCCGRGFSIAVGALLGGLAGAGVGAAGAKPAYEYPARMRVTMQAGGAAH